MKNILFIFIALLTIVSFSCRKDDVITDASAQLSFSTDTLIIDTVFTTIGSTTKRLMVYNKNNSKINISSISLDGGASSQFRINVDGASGNIHKDIEIEANDSLFIFIEVTIDPNAVNDLFIVKENLRFITNGNNQSVALVAWGQDAHYFVANQFSSGLPPLVYLDKDTSAGALNVTWPNDKPYVIYGGYLTLDGNDKLTIDKGVRIHLHNNSGLWVYKGGNIIINGTKDEPVTFQGTRLDYGFQDKAGQWDRIWINEGSVDNVFNYVTIKNAYIGIQAETLPFEPNTALSTNKLILNNCEIHNSSAVGVLATNYQIDSENSLITNCGQYNLLVTGGGKYNFNHTTIANYWPDGTRQTPAVFMQNYYTDINGATQVRNIDSALFKNCIIYGNTDNEFATEVLSPGAINFNVNYSVIKTNNLTPAGSFDNIQLNLSPNFIDTENHDYHIGGGSSAINNGIATAVTTDHDGVTRNNPPDVGAYEE
ncbi:MAG: hypothetical protein H6587_06110 [Flavobacteriales bacterium]|nr:hypothetical protein [Flavobacteriales bacterium]MCB9364121.1 hypothetical protein [Flavobacteriales bacterium]